jgi:hypothetical protein
VAVKPPRPGQPARAAAARAQEAQVAGSTADPGIRRLHEARLDRPLPHLVFEYVEGPALDDALATDGPFHPTDVLLAGMQLAAGALALLEAALPADAAGEDRLWPSWATPRLGAWPASTMARPRLAPRPA